MEVLKISTILFCLIHARILHYAFKSIGLEVSISIYVYSISVPAIQMQLQSLNAFGDFILKVR